MSPPDVCHGRTRNTECQGPSSRPKDRFLVLGDPRSWFVLLKLYNGFAHCKWNCWWQYWRSFRRSCCYRSFFSPLPSQHIDIIQHRLVCLGYWRKRNTHLVSKVHEISSCHRTFL